MVLNKLNSCGHEELGTMNFRAGVGGEFTR
jgi:hypothetical protein